MGLFGKKRSEEQTPPVKRTTIFDTDYPLDRTNWYEVFSACLGRSVVVQQRTADLVVKNRNWNVDFTAGTLSFGTDSYPVQFLGSEATASNSWMWGWNNINGFDERIITAAKDILSIGEGWQQEVFTTKSFEMDEYFNGHTLAIAATGVLPEGYAYYRGPHAGGSVFMLIRPNDPQVFAPVNMVEFIDWTMSGIQAFDVDHRIFAESFLLWNGTPYERDGSRLTAHFGAQRLDIDFEEAGDAWRIKSMKSN